MTTTLKNENNSKYGTSGDNATQDRVFLLSITEAESLFSGDSSRIAQNTAYAEAQGAYTNDSGAGWGWLRSPGLDQRSAAVVDGGGSLDRHGSYVDYGINAIRPALWLDLSSL